MVYFWTSNSIPLIYMSILLAVPHCSNHCFLVISFEIKNSESSNFVLLFFFFFLFFFFKMFFSILGLLQFHINFRMSSSVFMKSQRDWIGIALKLLINLGSISILILSYRIYEHGIYFLLCRYF